MSNKLSLDTATKSPPVIYGYVEQMMRVNVFKGNDETDAVQLHNLGVMQVGPWTHGLDKRPAGFSSAVILDNTLATALQKRSPALKHLVTTELQLNFLRNLPEDGDELTAWARPLSCTPEQCSAAGTLTDAAGNGLVEATAWYRPVVASSSANSNEYHENARLQGGNDTAQPLASILQVNDAADRDSHLDGFELQRGFTFRGDSRLANALGYVHGGAIAMMLGLTAQLAINDRVELSMQSLRVFYLRPGQGALQSHFRVRHAGRSFSIADVELLNADGKVVALAQASFFSGLDET